MTGITAYGACIPTARLPLATLTGRAAKEGGPEKAVAWNDEDAVTLGVAAARSCLEGLDRTRVDGVVFASTTAPYREKQTAALVARALDLRRDVRTADLGGSLRAGTTALRNAFDAIRSGSSEAVLVIASDCRMAAPGSPLESHLGDGAAAFLVSDRDVIAAPTAAFAVSEEIVDVWRSEADPFVHAWEDRFVVQEGYTPRVVEAVRGVAARDERDVADYDHLALYAPDPRSHAAAVRALGVAREAVQDPLFGRMGNAGAAFALLQLAAVLERARPGERIVVASYGDGAEAIALEVGEAIDKLEPRRGVAWHLARRRTVPRYESYRKARRLDPTEWPDPPGPGLSATVHFRERDDEIAFRGQQCRRCGAIQFPAQRVCETCFAKDDFESVSLADRTGRVVTYTLDWFFPTPDPPTVVAIVDVDGARLHLQLVDCPPERVRTGLPVRFVFRRIHEVGGRPNYYWKGTPVDDEEATPSDGR
jgi:3-hydroxy-3-methylglutaryl CoA synthase/uncharacterized OB-fold protein